MTLHLSIPPASSLLLVRTLMLGVLGAVFAHSHARAQSDSTQWRGDVATLDAIIEAYYDVVSGPAGGVIDTARDHYLHHPEARITLYRRQPGQPVNVDVVPLSEYHRRVGVGPRAQAFYEREIHRVEHVFGNMATVWSTYEYRNTPDGPATGRGINTITLARDADRWWITGWGFESETSSARIPSQYLPNN